MVSLVCPICKETFNRTPSLIKKNSTGVLVCSRRCHLRMINRWHMMKHHAVESQ